MFDNIFQTIEGIAIYPIFSLMIFFLFFLGLTIWVMKVDKKYIDKMSEIPFEK